MVPHAYVTAWRSGMVLLVQFLQSSPDACRSLYVYTYA